MEETKISVLSKHSGDVGHKTLYNSINNTKIDEEIISTNKENIFTCLSKNTFNLVENNDNNENLVMGDRNKN